jgi:hypothetical protein
MGGGAVRDLTPEEVRYVDREILAERYTRLLAEADQLRQQLAKPCGECHPCENHSALKMMQQIAENNDLLRELLAKAKTIEITSEMIHAYDTAEEAAPGTFVNQIHAGLSAALEAAGFTVTGGDPS